MEKRCWFLITLIIGVTLEPTRATSEDDHTVARWILAVESAEPDFGPVSDSSSSEEEPIPSLESIEDDGSQMFLADDTTARVFIPDIGKIKTIVDILKTVGEVVIPVIVEGIGGTVAGAASEVQGQLQASAVPEDVVAYKTRGVMFLQNAKKEIGNFHPKIIV